MKFIVASDLHVHKYRSFNQENRRLKNSIRLLDELWGLAYKNEAHLLIAGDLFNTMQTVYTEVMVLVTESFKRNAEKYPDVTCLLISGNHDYATKNFFDRPAVSAVQALNGVADNVIVIDNGHCNLGGVRIYGLPYYEYQEDLVKALTELSEQAGEAGGNSILLMHQSIGFGHELVPDDIDPSDPLFIPFSIILNGHIHKYEQIGDNFYNIGSPIHRDAGDIGLEKGVLLVDGTKVERIILRGYPQFRRLSEDQPCPAEWEEDYIIKVPAKIEILPEEQVIAERFNPVGNDRVTLLNNYLEIKLDNKSKQFKKDVNAYGAKLLSDAAEV